MMDNFGSFLRQQQSEGPVQHQLLQPDILGMLYDGVSTVTDTDLSATLQHSVNFVGMMEAVDLVAVLEDYDREGLSDCVLVSCPPSPPQSLSRLNSSPPSTSLAALLSTVTSFHHVRSVQYILAPEALVLFRQYASDMEDEMTHYRMTERQRGMYAKAPAQLIRLAAVLTALRNALSAVKCGEGTVLPTCTMSKEMLTSAHTILSHCIKQKLLLMPSPDGMLPPDHPEEEFLIEDSMEQIQEGSFRADESRMVSSSGKPDVIEVPSSPDPSPPWPVAMMAVNREGNAIAMQMNPMPTHPLRAQVTQVPLIGQPQVMSLQQSVSMVTSGPLNAPPMHSLAQHHLPQPHQANQQQHPTPPGSLSMALPVSIPSSLSHTSDAAAGLQGLQSQMGSMPMDGLDDSYLGPLEAPYAMAPYQRKLKSHVNINDLSDEELVSFASQKIRRLLLLDGLLFAAATICQKKLFPSIPRHLRPSNPQTTHPVWGAVNFMARVAKMGLGEIVHQAYRVRSYFFRKIRLEFMSASARELLKDLNISEEEYERTYPKVLDQDIMNNYVVVQDLDSLQKNDPDVEAFLKGEGAMVPEGSEGEMGEKNMRRPSWPEQQ